MSLANTTSQKQGLILAAGLGSRLGATEMLKPLIPVHGKALIIRTLETLEAGGCTQFIIVLGHEATTIEHYINTHYQGNSSIVYAYNNQYHLSNGLSVLAASKHLQAGFVLSMADHLFSEQIPMLLNTTALPKEGAALFVDYKIEEVFDLDDATKVLTQGDEIIDIGKTIEPYNCIDTGLFLCSRDLITALEQVYADKGDASLSEGMAVLGKQHKMKAIDIGSACWQDVDDPAMLEQGWKMIRNCEST